MACAACGETHPEGAQHCPRTGEPVGTGPCGTRIDRYQVERLIGGGGMGAVYRAKHVMLGQSVALKLLRARAADSKELVQRFQREAQVAAAVGNPHIVRVSDFGETPEGQPFLVMELLDGADLDSVIARRGPLPVEQAVDVTLQVLDGLAAAHGAGVIHRDLKPANVFLTHPPGQPNGPRDFVKIVDFGISKVTTEAGHSLTRTGMVLGTPYYMAPEQARAAPEQDHRVDLYAASVILYQMLSRALPFVGSSYEELVIKICTEPARPLAELAPHVPAAILEVVERGMARDPGERWPTAAAFAEALRGAAGVLASSSPPTPAAWPTPAPSAVVATPAPTPPPQPAPPARSFGMLAAALVLLALAILAAAAAAIWVTARSAEPVAMSSTVSSPVPVAPNPAPMLVPIPGPTPAPTPPQATEDDDDFDFDMSDMPTAEELARLTQQAQSFIPIPPAPEPTGGVGIGEPYVVGDLSAGELSRFLRRAGPALQRCRAPGRSARVRVQLMIAGGLPTAPMSVPVAGADPAQQACVTNAVRDVLQQLGPSATGGIVYVEIALAAR